MLLVLPVSAQGDAIVGRDRILLPPLLTQGRALFTFVPATLGTGNWAARELQAFRSIDRPVAYTESSVTDVFRDGGLGVEGGTDQVDPFQGLNIGTEESTSPGGLLDTMGDAAFANALAAWGLSLADMQTQLPKLALEVGSYIDYLNNASIGLIKSLRKLLLGNVSLKGTPALESLGTREGDASVAAGRGGGGDDAKRKEDLKTTKRVVRSALKIVLGFLLGLLLWMLVSRM